MMNFDNRLATSDWYNANYYSQLGDFKGSEIKISKVCNPDFKNTYGQDCDIVICAENAINVLNYAVQAEDGTGWQTPLNCPRCGCQNNNPITLMDFDGFDYNYYVDNSFLPYGFEHEYEYERGQG